MGLPAYRPLFGSHWAPLRRATVLLGLESHEDAATQKLTLPKHNRMRYINHRHHHYSTTTHTRCSFIATDDNVSGRRSEIR